MGLVAGGVPVSTAIPMVMGANIGTTLTSTIVSLGHVRASEEFRRAFAAATIHDMYNVLSVAILFPLELIFHPLERITILISQFMLDSKNIDMAAFDFMRAITRPTARLVTSAFSYNLPELFAGLAMIVLGITMILFVVTYIGRLLRRLTAGHFCVRSMMYEAAHKARKDWGFPFFSLNGWHISATNSYAVGQVHLTSPGRSGIGTAFKSSLRNGITSPGDQPISYYAASSRPVLFCSISPLCPLN